MDSQSAQPIQASITPNTASFPEKIINKIKNLSKKQKIAAGIFLLVLLGILGFAFFVKNPAKDNPDTPVARVGDTSLPRAYVDLELNFFPGKPTPEIEKAIVEKIVNDQISLEAGKKEGLIADYPQSSKLSAEEYLQRTNLVKNIEKAVDDRGSVIKGKTVMVWFYNNQHIGPEGFEKNREIAYSKIKPVYDRVKSREITIDQAGSIIRSDKSLAAIDPVWEVNALAPFVYYKNGTATFWPGFNEILWNTEPGQVTPLYVGGGILRHGKPVDELYIFSQIDEKSNNSSYSDYNEWLEKKRQEYNVQYSLVPVTLDFIPKVLAEDDYGQGGYYGEGGYGNEGNSGNGSGGGSGGGDNPDNGSRSGVWYGRVTTATGLPVPGANVRIENGCTTRNETTNGSGGYNTGVDYNLSCLCNPQKGSAFYNGVLCEEKPGIAIANGDASIEVNFRCDVSSSPTPTPTLNSSVPTPTPSPTPVCSPLPAETRNVACPPGHTGTIVETRTSSCPGPNWSSWTTVSNTCTPPPACGDSCTSDSYCFGAPDGCTSCVPNDAGTGSVCARPPVCGSSCVRDDQCIGAAARNGCTACVSGTCRIPPSCGTACTTRADCAGAKDNCSECLEGTCTDYSDNMCKCDGMTADMVYPGNSFKFEAFGKVEGGDIKKAQIADITFRMTKDNQVVAKSNPIVPTVVQNSGTKMRFKAAWSTPPPPISKNSTYRVFADVRCKPKRIVASNGELASSQIQQKSEDPKAYPPKGLEWVINNIAKLFGGKVNPFVSEVLAQLSSPSPSPSGAQTNLQLQTLNFVKLIDTDNCKFVMFKFDEALF